HAPCSVKQCVTLDARSLARIGSAGRPPRGGPMLRVIRAALFTGALALCAPAAAQAAPPACTPGELTTLPGVVLHLPEPACEAPVTVTSVGDPGHGTIDPGARTYTPDDDFHGRDEFIVRVEDVASGDEGTIRVTVVVDTPPTCDNTSATMPSGSSMLVPELPC